MTATTRFAAGSDPGMGGQKEVSLGSCSGVVTEWHGLMVIQLLRTLLSRGIAVG
jgi:hypothetical protein